MKWKTKAKKYNNSNGNSNNNNRTHTHTPLALNTQCMRTTEHTDTCVLHLNFRHTHEKKYITECDIFSAIHRINCIHFDLSNSPTANPANSGLPFIISCNGFVCFIALPIFRITFNAYRTAQHSKYSMHCTCYVLHGRRGFPAHRLSSLSSSLLPHVHSHKASVCCCCYCCVFSSLPIFHQSCDICLFRIDSFGTTKNVHTHKNTHARVRPVRTVFLNIHSVHTNMCTLHDIAAVIIISLLLPPPPPPLLCSVGFVVAVYGMYGLRYTYNTCVALCVCVWLCRLLCLCAHTAWFTKHTVNIISMIQVISRTGVHFFFVLFVILIRTVADTGEQKHIISHNESYYVMWSENRSTHGQEKNDSFCGEHWKSENIHIDSIEYL